MLNKDIFLSALAIFFMFLSLSLKGQEQEQVAGDTQNQPKTVRQSPEFQRQATIYLNALKYNDPATAKVALYNLLALQPNNSALADSLALMYFDGRQYLSAALVAQDILSGNPNDTLALEIAAVSFDQIGLKDKALENYESLYLRKDRVFTLYKIASLQYELKRFKESKTSADIILNKKGVDTLNVYFNLDKKQEEVPLTAAVYNLKGLIASGQKNNEEAAKFYQQALSIAPEFSIARNNLEALNKEE